MVLRLVRVCGLCKHEMWDAKNACKTGTKKSFGGYSRQQEKLDVWSMHKVIARGAAAVALGMALLAPATAGMFNLSQSPGAGDQRVVELSFGDIAELEAMVGSLPGTGLTSVGMTFRYEGGWATSPYVADSLKTAPALDTQVTVDETNRSFSFDVIFDPGLVPVNGGMLALFSVAKPKGAGVLWLDGINLDGSMQLESTRATMLSSVELGVGPSLPFPEPGTWYMTLGGLVMLGALMRRRQRGLPQVFGLRA